LPKAGCFLIPATTILHACSGYLDHHRAQGGWHADVMQDFLTWVEAQAARNDDLSIHATALLRAAQRDRSG